MPLIAESEHTIAGPIETVFSRFIDYRLWSAWMPKTFRPVRGPARPLRTGDRILVSLGGLPALLRVDHVEGPREVSWSGGVPGVLHARHTFTFEALGEKVTRIRSSEPWTGLLTDIKPVAGKIQATAESAGRAQLAGFDRVFRDRSPLFWPVVPAARCLFGSDPGRGERGDFPPVQLLDRVFGEDR